MSTRKFSVWILGFLTLIICSFFYFRSNRFEISKEEGSISYKIDQWTGESWVLYGDQQIKVESEKKEPQKELTNAVVIEKVKEDKTLVYNFSNEFEIRSQLEELEGNLKILGWEAKKVDDQTFLVSYKYNHNGQEKGYYFELNTKADLIRNISNDYDLEVKYGLIKLDSTKKDTSRTFNIDDIDN